ncbi:MAG: hypothetical protein QOI96_1797 [Verrucomicrobiota bacterium]
MRTSLPRKVLRGLQRPGSARASRADFGALAEILLSNNQRRQKVCDREDAITGTRGRVRSPDQKSARRTALDYAGFLQRGISAVLVYRLQAARGNTDAHMPFEFRHPDTVFVQIRREDTRHIFRDVPPDAALFLGHTAAVDDAAARGFCSGDSANSGHKMRKSRERCRASGVWSSES